MTVVAVIGVLSWEWLIRRFGTALTLVGVVGLVLLTTSPLVLGVGLAAVGVWRIASQVSERRHIVRRAEQDVAVFARGLFVAISAGLSPSAAFAVASEGLSAAVADEVASLVRASRKDGMALALAEADGRCGRLFGLLARAHTTGASMADAIAGYVEEQRESHRLKVTEAARRLPIKLTVPLALLILPGFVVLTVGPSVLESARRLLGPVIPIP